MRRFARVVSGIAVLITLALLMAGPAAGASAHRPDGWVRTQGYHDSYSGTNYAHQGSWKGKNIYNTTALNQTAVYKMAGAALSLKDYFYFTVNIQNDGTVSDRFKVHGPSGYKYFHGTTNVTAAVVAGTFKTGTLSPGSSYRLQLRIFASGGTALLTLTSVGDPTKVDAVKAKAVWFCGC